ncbi:hypothetical protein [Nostocoides sp. HKS02]|uniref:hypothetical protein n=1 Tax=Nostocoides sp. HKS02 TaxID=1813880 RepID=UPI0012B4B236|nr:hypothetical protein [Tetrasphaera sp. HKS02]QGN56779.1 hypothetical protein GKE56_01385 [Tetrasphaera sp. HKS02]
MSAPNHHHEDTPSTFPRSSKRGPNLATLDRVRGLRRPRLMQPEARRHQLPAECRAC